MKQSHRPWQALALSAALSIAALYLSACDRTPESLKRPNMTDLSPRLQPLFEKTRTVCFGRFVIEVPATATVVYGPAHVSMPIERYPGEGSRLAESVAEREQMLKSEARYPKSQGLNLYVKTLDGVMPGQKIVIGYETFSSPFYKVESLLNIGEDLFVQRMQAYPKKKEGEQSELWSTTEAIANLNMIAQRLRTRAADEVPTEPGICIDGGFVSEPPQYVYEWITLGVRLKEFPDVHFSISVTKKDILVESDAIEPRLKRAEKDAHKRGQGEWYSRIQFFRRGTRQLGDWTGFEVLARMPAQENVSERHEFAFLSQGVPKDPFKPVLDIKLDTGVKKNTAAGAPPSLSDEEAVALWDKLISSIRVRPTGAAPAKTSEAVPTPQLPLGELAATGLACPQTGWWQCAETGEVQGGRRQRLMAGEPMPHAVLLGESNVWQKLKGERPMHKTATVWKLVDYDEPQKSADAPTAAPMPTIAQAVTDDSETKEPADGTANDALPAQDARKDNNNDAADSSKA
jgi:hypothetical protein